MPKKKPKPESNGEPKPGLSERLARANRSTESPEERLARIDATLERMKAEANSPGRGSPQFIVRYPDEAMRAKIARLAKKNNRSINSEIIDRLQKSMIEDTIANLEESMGEIFDRVEKLERMIRDRNN